MDGRWTRVEMEEGMCFEFECWEEEEARLEEPDDLQNRSVLDPPFNTRFIFIDIRDANIDEKQQVIGVRDEVIRRNWMTHSLKLCFPEYFGHGLLPQELSKCVDELCAVVDRVIVINQGDGHGNGDLYRRRQLWFHVKRRGVVGTRYHAQEIAMRKEEDECINRLNKMWEAGFNPTDPYTLDRILGRSKAKVGDECYICWEGFVEEECATRLLCHHPFHTYCIAEWLCRKNTCPVCRFCLRPMMLPSCLGRETIPYPSL